MTSPVDTVRDFYAVLAKGDVPGVVALLHPTLEWTEAQGFPYYSGTWRTPQEVIEKLLAPLMRDWDDFSADVDDFIVQGDRVVSLGSYAGVSKTTGKAMRSPFAHVWRVTDGRLARFNMYADTWLIRTAMEVYASPP